MTKRKKVIILGGGLAGLSLACELVEEHFDVIVIEKKPYLGGRASNTHDRKMGDPVPIGPHVFVTAYKNMRRFLKKIGAEHTISWQKRIFVEVIYDGAHHFFRHTRLPHPLYMVPWLANFPFIGLPDKATHWRLGLQILTKSNTALERLDGKTAYTYLKELGVSESAINVYWRFLTLSLLNVPVELASAAEFSLLFKHWSRLRNRKIGFARYGLGDLYTHNAEKYITDRGGSVVKNIDVRKIRTIDGKVTGVTTVHGDSERTLSADIVVSTLNPIDLAKILPRGAINDPFFDHLRYFKPVPYITVNLWFDRKITTKQFWALIDVPGGRRYLNTDFYDQSNIYAHSSDKSFITSNIIYAQRHSGLTDAEIIHKTLEELREVFPSMDAKLVHSHVHRIPYVVYATHPGMRKHKRPHRTPIKGLYLSGDWTSPEVQCMETAVRSAYSCAEELLEDEHIYRKLLARKIE